MDRQAFKQRMKQLKQYREQNPGKTYFDFKSYVEGGQTGDPNEYITQKIQEKRKEALLKSQQRDKGVLPVVGGRPNPVTREEFMKTREQDIQKASRDVEDFKKLANLYPSIYQQKLDVANKKLQALQATTYQPTIGGEIGPGCIYTATDNYGPMYQRASNVEFESLPASKSGFTKVPLNKVQAGDIVIRHGDNGSRHAMIFDSYGPDSTMLYNHSNGGGETTDYRHKGRYPSKKEQLNAYTFTGTHNDSVNWKKQAGFAEGGEIGNDEDKDPSVLDKVKSWAKDLYLSHKYKSSAAAMEVAYNFQNKIPSLSRIFGDLKTYFKTDMPNRDREDFSVQNVFLLNEEDQKEVMQRAGFQVIDIDKEDNPYGLVNKAAKRHKRVPVYQDNSKSDTTVVRDDVYPIANAYGYDKDYGVELMRANSFPRTMYIHKKTGKLYSRGWDLNDYGVDPNGSGIAEGYSKLSRLGANVLDKIGTPFVQRSGFVPFDEKSRYDRLDDKTKQAIKTARHRVKFDSFYADGGEIPPTNKPIIPEDPQPYKGKLYKDRYGKKYTEDQLLDYYDNSTDEVDKFTGKPLVRGLKPVGDIEDAANVTPVGDVISAYDAYSSARQGDWVGAGLSTLAMLPFVPMSVKEYRRKYKGITRKVKSKNKLNSNNTGVPTSSKTNVKPFNTTVNRDRTQQLIDQVTNKYTINNAMQAKASNQGYKIAERLMDDPEYLDRALQVKKKFGDDYTTVYADIIDAYNNNPNSYLPVVDVYNNPRSSVNGSMRNLGHGNYNYTVNADMADLSANLTEHEWSHYADFKRNLDRPDAHGDSNMFYQMSKDLDNKKIDNRDSYYQMPTEQKAHMNQLREYMFQNGYITKRGETIESKMMKNVLDDIRNIPSMKGVFRASQQFKNINKYTKWFNSIPLLGVGAAAMYNNQEKSN